VTLFADFFLEGPFRVCFSVLLGFARGFRKELWRKRGFLMVKRGVMCGECGGLADVNLGLKNAPTSSVYFDILPDY
jgi:hypothetical protein